MYWPYDQGYNTACPSVLTKGVPACVLPRSLFCRSAPPDMMRNLPDKPPPSVPSWLRQQQQRWLSISFRDVFQPITKRVFPRTSSTGCTAAAAADPVFNQSVPTSAASATARAGRNGLEREHDQPACSR
ncbi:uncharacterized protein LOC143280310 [Babylonia areolata]|uniref:uncharacterized protein LOC143280310 n=1 Tax=Babylonia areolata TaxID=304850 RepID=UPI003FD0293D